MDTIRAVQVPEAGAALELVHREPPEPGPGQVRVRVQACGICHSDAMTKEGLFPGIGFPRVPGHEVAGVVEATGPGVVGWEPGERVGVGWFGGHCGRCEPCRRGDLIDCTALQIPGISYDGGYADAMVVPTDALARLPEELSPVEAAPLMCAGITTYNALRHSDARAGDLVAVLGVGGLGHLGIQFAAKMGMRTVAIARGPEKEALALELGAAHYIDSTAEDPGKALTELGGARTILATVTNPETMSTAVDGLGTRGTLVVIGASTEAIRVSPMQLIGGSRAIVGHASGTSQDSEDTLRFSVLAGVRPSVEAVPLDQAAWAYERMASGDARFRMVLTT
ncbi:MAG TPA: alcohol dehydrogenase [Acidimicrobiales bacterium]|nr:alcohol dehydrogenase [Acidimicrobiales bacterium]